MQIRIIMDQNTIKPKLRSQIVTIYVNKDSTNFWRLVSCLERPKHYVTVFTACAKPQ